MQLLRFIILIIGIYMAYRFVFHFLLPVYRTSKRMHREFKGMQEKMNEHMQANPSQYGNASQGKPKPTGSPVNKKDYIDFEEIR